MQLVPYPNEAFFWYNGGIYYSFFYSLSLILFGLILALPYARRRAGKAIRYALIILLSAVISGGNYTTVLCALLILLFFCILFTVTKENTRFITYVALAVFIAGMAVSIFSPGNAVRASGLEQMSAPLAIAASFFYAFLFAVKHFNLFLLAFYVFLIPLMLLAAMRCNFSFRYPLIVVAASLCLFAAQFAPALYAMGNTGGERQIDIYYYAFILLLLLDLFYCTGWACRRFARRNASASRASYPVSLLAPVCLCVVVLCFPLKSIVSNMSSVSASLSLIRGEAQSFSQARDERLALYLDPSVSDVILQPYPVVPYVFKGDGMSPDPGQWQNMAVAQFYDKSSVSIMADNTIQLK